jgi:hypothetical protein
MHVMSLTQMLHWVRQVSAKYCHYKAMMLLCGVWISASVKESVRFAALPARMQCGNKCKGCGGLIAREEEVPLVLQR